MTIEGSRVRCESEDVFNCGNRDHATYRSSKHMKVVVIAQGGTGEPLGEGVPWSIPPAARGYDVPASLAGLRLPGSIRRAAEACE